MAGEPQSGEVRNGLGTPLCNGDEAIKYLPHPELALPVPKLTYDFRMSVDLNPKVGVGIVPSGDLRN
ncbi:hypothetical protein F5Y09DRAFT_343735 [Xylaria sp. FL1042]|nr:hypothetical protein F5Y09DRAFT_343735 [Xylaria sp. FL1042]